LFMVTNRNIWVLFWIGSIAYRLRIFLPLLSLAFIGLRLLC